jgi:pimeloyl-ACP methyl ester carboxylesterase
MIHKGHSVVYRQAGSGEAVLLIHGFPTSSWDWHYLWLDLTARFHVVALDMIGFGLSAKPPGYDYSLFDQADIQEQLLRRLGITRTHVLAHDYGDTVAQELLARYYEREERGQKGLVLDSVCLLNGGIFPETNRPLFRQRLLSSPLGPLLGHLITQDKFNHELRSIFGAHTPPSEQDLVELWTLVCHNQGLRVIPRILRYLKERKRARARWVGALQGGGVPLRLINGAADPISGRHMADRYQKLVVNADVFMLAEIGHYPHLEAPKEVLRAYLDFMGHTADQPPLLAPATLSN